MHTLSKEIKEESFNRDKNVVSVATMFRELIYQEVYLNVDIKYYKYICCMTTILKLIAKIPQNSIKNNDDNNLLNFKWGKFVYSLKNKHIDLK